MKTLKTMLICSAAMLCVSSCSNKKTAVEAIEDPAIEETPIIEEYVPEEEVESDVVFYDKQAGLKMANKDAEEMAKELVAASETKDLYAIREIAERYMKKYFDRTDEERCQFFYWLDHHAELTRYGSWQNLKYEVNEQQFWKVFVAYFENAMIRAYNDKNFEPLDPKDFS